MFNIPEASLTSDWWKNSVTSLLIDNVENNENNRGQKYPLQGVTRFNQVVIKLQLITAIAFCNYEEEKKTYATRFLPCRCPGHHAERGYSPRVAHNWVVHDNLSSGCKFKFENNINVTKTLFHLKFAE